MKRIGLLGVLAVVLVAICGCSSGPSKSDMADQVKSALLADGGDELFEVVDIEVVDGRAQSETEYESVVEYTLRFKVGLNDLVNEARKSSKGLDAFTNMMVLAGLEETYGQFKAGDTVTNKESHMFMKMESGWQLAI